MLSYEKKITSSGGITIPKDLRNRLGIGSGEAVSLVVEDGDIRITRRKICRICGTHKNVSSVSGLALCKTCVKEYLNVK